MTTEGTPTWTVDKLSVSAELITDDLGREWGVRSGGDDGWIAAPAPRTARSDRPGGHGSYRSAGYRDVRQVTLAGFVACPSPAVREQTENELAALCSDPGRLYDLRRRTDSYDQFVSVELDEAPKVEMVTRYRLDWQFTFAAPDPRKHDFQVQAPVAGPPVSSAPGLDFSDPGLNFASPGLDFGSPAIPQPVSVGNYGTAPAFPVIEVFGPAVSPTISCLTSGFQFTYSGTLEDGEVLSINCDAFPREGFPPRRAISNLHGDVRSLLNLTGWPQVDPGALETFTLQATATPTTTLRVILRSAWW